jgi:hypothetical protein
MDDGSLCRVSHRVGAGLEPAIIPATNPDEVAPSSVQISATRDPELKSYRQLLKGLNAYESHLAKAPDSVFRFLLIPQKPMPVCMMLACVSSATTVQYRFRLQTMAVSPCRVIKKRKRIMPIC